MHEAIGNQVTTSRHDGTATATGLPGEVFTRRVITVVLSLITGLTFAFGFGNVWALGRDLGVPAFVAPLVGPAVDLSVAGLLVAIRHLSMTGVPRDQLRAARILLTACGTATLALNIAGPVAAGAYGRAGFDSVGPLLLIGWAETGPGLLRHLYATRSRQLPAHAGHSAAGSLTGDAARDAVTVRTRTRTRDEPSAPDRQAGSSPARRAGRPHRIAVADMADLLGQARRLDHEHRMRHARPVSAETLRREMRIGSTRARTLVRQIRALPEPAAPAGGAPSHPAADQQHRHTTGGTGSEQPIIRPAVAGDLAVVAS